MPVPIPKKISQILPIFQNVAQTSHYLVNFGLPSKGLKEHLQARGVDHRFDMNEIGLLCCAAVLPGSTFATQLVRSNYQGVVETFPHTRNFTEIQLDFYVDNEYKSLKFLEHWMEYITGGNQVDPGNDTYYFQLNYPRDYKSNDTTIVKFEKDHQKFLEYRFVGLFPLSLNSVRVQYGNSQVLKATCSFSYDRYISGQSSSLARDLRRAYNDLGFGRGNVNRHGLSLKDDQLNELAARSTFRYLNERNTEGSYSSLSAGGFKQRNVSVTYPTTPPGIVP